MYEEAEARRIAAQTYRRTASELSMQANLLSAQAFAFSEAANRIERGEEPLTLTMPAPAPEEPEGPMLVERIRALTDDEASGAAAAGDLVREVNSLYPSGAMQAWIDSFHEERRADPRFIDAVNAAAGLPIGPEATDIVMGYLREGGVPACEFETPEGPCLLDVGHEGRHDPNPERS